MQIEPIGAEKVYGAFVELRKIDMHITTTIEEKGSNFENKQGLKL